MFGLEENQLFIKKLLGVYLCIGNTLCVCVCEREREREYK